MNKRGYHRVRIGRCGTFVGLFRPLENDNWTLWRTIDESDPYGKYEWCWPWFSGEEPFNELHRLPRALNVMDADEMKCVANLLGGSKYTVQRRISEFALGQVNSRTPTPARPADTEPSDTA